MPSTYSTLLRLEQQADDENVDSWGVRQNAKHALLENAIAGTLVKSVTGSGDLLLTTANGLEDESRYAVLHLTGDITAARRILIPATAKVYVVYNDTTGSFPLTISTGAGVDTAVKQGHLKTIICTGVDVLPSTPDLDPDSDSLETSGGLFTQGEVSAKTTVAGNGVSLHSESGIASITLRGNISAASDTPWNEVGDDICQLEIAGGTSTTNASALTLYGKDVPGVPGFARMMAPVATPTARMDFVGYGGGVYTDGSRLWDDTYHPGTVSFQELMWPVGSIYFHSDDEISPAALIGVGVWDAAPTDMGLAVGGFSVYGWRRVA